MQACEMLSKPHQNLGYKPHLSNYKSKKVMSDAKTRLEYGGIKHEQMPRHDLSWDPSSLKLHHLLPHASELFFFLLQLLHTNKDKNKSKNNILYLLIPQSSSTSAISSQQKGKTSSLPQYIPDHFLTGFPQTDLHRQPLAHDTRHYFNLLPRRNTTPRQSCLTLTTSHLAIPPFHLQTSNLHLFNPSKSSLLLLVLLLLPTPIPTTLSEVIHTLVATAD